MSPGNSGAPGVRTGGDQKIQLAGCDSIIPVESIERWANPTYRHERAAVFAERRRRTACLELSAHLSRVEFSEAWTRRWANELVQRWGFDPAYVARQYGLTMRRAA